MRVVRDSRILLRGLAVLIVLVTVLSGCGNTKNSTSATSTSSSQNVASGSGSGKGSTYVVGAIESETAATGAITDISSTLKAWQAYVNGNGGIQGHPVKVDAINDHGDPGQSVTAFQRLASEHALAIIDGTTLDAAWASSAASAHIPVLCGTEVANGFTCSANPDFFPAGGTVLPELYGDYAAAKAAGANSIGIVYCTESAACKQAIPVSAGFIKSLGLRMAPSLAASSTAPSYGAQCIDLASQKIEACLPGRSAHAEAGPRLHAAGLQAHVHRGQRDVGERLPDRSQLIRRSPCGHRCRCPLDRRQHPATQAFHQAIGNLINTAFSPYNVLTTWAAGLLFQAAASSAGTNPTGQTIISGLYALKGETLGGFSPPLTFTPDKAHSVPYYFPLSIKDDKWYAPNGDQPSHAPLFSSS